MQLLLDLTACQILRLVAALNNLFWKKLRLKGNPKLQEMPYFPLPHSNEIVGFKMARERKVKYCLHFFFWNFPYNCNFTLFEFAVSLVDCYWNWSPLCNRLSHWQHKGASETFEKKEQIIGYFGRSKPEWKNLLINSKSLINAIKHFGGSLFESCISYCKWLLLYW